MTKNMSQCNHATWLGFVEGEAAPLLSYGWRFARVVEEMHDPSEQFPHLVFFMGRSQKDRALQRLCESSHHSKKYQRESGNINLRTDNASVQSKHPWLFADCDPLHCNLLPAVNSPNLCHR